MTWFSKELFNSNTSNIFVFGSNQAGRHGAGAAKFAINYCGAIYGKGFGIQGNSFAIPTKNHNLEVLQLSTIKTYVDEFIKFTIANPKLIFYITPIGTGLAGYSDVAIAPLFANCGVNCIFPDRWRIAVKNNKLTE